MSSCSCNDGIVTVSNMGGYDGASRLFGMHCNSCMPGMAKLNGALHELIGRLYRRIDKLECRVAELEPAEGRPAEQLFDKRARGLGRPR